MSFRLRSYLFLGFGCAFIANGYRIDPCAVGPGACAPFSRLWMGSGFMIAAVFGLCPLINRWFWGAMKMKENEYQLTVWHKRIDGPFGEVIEWMSGIDRDGTLK